MDLNAVWQWLRPMVGFFMLGVGLLILVYLLVRMTKKKNRSSAAN